MHCLEHSDPQDPNYKVVEEPKRETSRGIEGSQEGKAKVVEFRFDHFQDSPKKFIKIFILTEHELFLVLGIFIMFATVDVFTRCLFDPSPSFRRNVILRIQSLVRGPVAAGHVQLRHVQLERPRSFRGTAET